MTNNWFVITGGPSSGKSTTIQLLKDKGYKTTTETARSFIESQFDKGFTMDQIRSDHLKFQRTVFNLQCKLEDGLASKELTFLDRAVPDTIGYLRYRQLSVPKDILDVCSQNMKRYKKVFLLEQLPFEADQVRVETNGDAERISEQLTQVYMELGAQLVKVPVMKKEKRVEFILTQVASL